MERANIEEILDLELTILHSYLKVTRKIEMRYNLRRCANTLRNFFYARDYYSSYFTNDIRFILKGENKFRRLAASLNKQAS